MYYLNADFKISELSYSDGAWSYNVDLGMRNIQAASHSSLAAILFYSPDRVCIRVYYQGTFDKVYLVFNASQIDDHP